jgi:hypothetical protein
VAEVSWLDLALDWLRIAAIFVAFSATSLAAILGAFWLCTKPMGRGPKRIVDIHNRGLTQFQMPDGTIK